MYSIDPLTRALVKEGRDVGLKKVKASTTPERMDEVVVKMAFAGICRTDLYAAEGRLAKMAPRVVLGHEGAGVVVAIGKNVDVMRVAIDDPVAILPRVACETCVDPMLCEHARRLGVDRDGAFADVVRVPLASVRRLPPQMSLKLGAYVEPVAAALAIKPCVNEAQTILIHGSNRIAELTRRIVALVHPGATVLTAPPEEGSTVDLAIETAATNETLQTLTHAVRRRGTILLKSRPVEPIAFDVGAAVEKEITLRAVRYGSFDDAIDLLASGRLDTSDLLLAETFPLHRWEEAFAMARKETTKPFFEMMKI